MNTIFLKEQNMYVKQYVAKINVAYLHPYAVKAKTCNHHSLSKFSLFLQNSLTSDTQKNAVKNAKLG